MNRSPHRTVQLKRRALGWTLAKLAAESDRTVEEISILENEGSSDERLTGSLLAVIDAAIAPLLPYWEKVLFDPNLKPATSEEKVSRTRALIEFGKLVRDRRERAKLSRKDLAQLVGVSDATIKFVETARHPPSRGTCQRLVSVKALKLTWEDVAKLGYVGPQPEEPASASPADADTESAPAPDMPTDADRASAPKSDSHMPTDADTTSAPAPEAATDADRPSAPADTSEEEITVHMRIYRIIRRKR